MFESVTLNFESQTSLEMCRSLFSGGADAAAVRRRQRLVLLPAGVLAAPAGHAR
jgi:hypothetical protein